MNRTLIASCLLAFTCSLAFGADALENVFQTPPSSTQPYMYWYWLNNNVSAKGITADLEAMKQAGIGEVYIGHVISDGIPEGDVPILSPEWWQLVEFAVREGDRIGVRVGMFNGPGWSQSGGPWMKPELSMRYLVSAETRVAGGAVFSGVPAKHAKAIQEVSVIAYPVPAQDGATVRPARVTSSAAVAGLDALLASGGPAVALPAAPLTLDLFFDRPALLQTLTLDFGDSPVRLAGTLEAVRGGAVSKVRDLAVFRTNLSTAMGPLVAAPFVFSFAPTEADHLRLTFTRLEGKPVAHGIAFSAAARIDFAAEKQLGRMYPEPVPPPDAFVWPRQPEPATGTAVDVRRIVDLTSRLAQDGTLTWQAPAGGDWIIAHIGMASTGVKCGPTPPQAQGLECDKMSRAAVDAHFDGMIGEFLRRIPADRRKGFQHITLDSYEVGPQNWTDGMTGTFKETYGYDPTPWLACLSGRVIGSRDQTDRFLWDWRRLVADLIARNYVGGLKAAANRHGLKTWLENYGHWGFPGESLQYGGASDDIGGEYWLWSSLGDVECRLATSCAHVYGKRVVSAESFTSGKNFVQTPANMKTRGDWCMAQGINHFVLHVYAHQPYGTAPGIVPWFGSDFNRNSTWFKEFGKGWTDYLRRCCALLQQGTHAADVAYFFGEDTPRMNGRLEPALPPGHDYDYINAEVLLTRASCKNGRLALPDGQSYRVLVLPPCETMTPRLLAKIASFVRDGLVLVGNPPLRSPSLADYPDCDAAVLKNAQALWGDTATPVVDRRVRKGRVFRGHTLEQVFGKIGVSSDVASVPKEVLWTHRIAPDADLYFVSNQSEKPIAIAPEFRVAGKRPELWDAVTDTRCEPALFETLPNATRVPLRLDPAGSVFVVFRKPLADRVPVRSLALNGATVLSCEKMPFSETAITIAAKQALASSAVRTSLPPSLFFSPAGALTLSACTPGRYEAVLSDGTRRTWQIAGQPIRLPLDNTAWSVTFRQTADTVFALPFATLQDWKDNADPRVKYFSGTAVYAGRFRWDAPRSDARVFLDLGDVKNIAAVTLNGRDLGILWKKPFRADLTNALKAGDNLLEIRVANDWFNRFIGDEQFADDTGANAHGAVDTWPDWMLKGTPRPEPQRVTFTTHKQVTKDTPLHASGLLGPVTVFEEVSAQ